MSETTFRAMGTDWFVRVDGIDSSLLRRIEARVRAEERRFSRFRTGSALSRLNARRRIREPVVAEVLHDALRFRRWTRGAFDPTVGHALAAAGYDRSFEAIEAGRVQTACRPCGELEARIEGADVRLSGEGEIDLGGIVKGWTVDLAARLIEEQGAPGYLVDGGGDIRVGGRPGDAEAWPVGLPDGHTVHLTAGAVATSSTLRRRWLTASGAAHHIISPRTGRPAEEAYVTAVVIAPDAETADVLGTALIADAASTLPFAERAGADVMLEDRDGAWTMTTGMARWLTP